MTKTEAKTKACHVCGQSFPEDQMYGWLAVRPGVSRVIEGDHPGWGEGSYICASDLAEARRAYVEALLEEERGEIGALERQVVEALAVHQTVSENVSATATERLTTGDRLADRVAALGGSWTFILGFLALLFVWMGINALHVLRQPFDPYPFILLNLVLSTLAAFQAPIIMMSQRRQEQKDRLRAENDYRVNLKAELEIRQLHEKIDHQLAHQWEKLAELQKLQIDLLEENAHGRGKR
jgi:uncharacterized membrane protein